MNSSLLQKDFPDPLGFSFTCFVIFIPIPYPILSDTAHLFLWHFSGYRNMLFFPEIYPDYKLKILRARFCGLGFFICLLVHLVIARSLPPSTLLGISLALDKYLLKKKNSVINRYWSTKNLCSPVHNTELFRGHPLHLWWPQVYCLLVEYKQKWAMSLLGWSSRNRSLPLPTARNEKVQSPR